MDRAEPSGAQAPMIALVERLYQRDEAAFTEIVVALDADLLRMAYVIAGDADAARDAVQETWERLWRKPPHLRDASSLRAWLLRVTANQCRQSIRGSRRRKRREEQVAPPDHVDEGSPRESRIFVGQMLRQLPPDDRELLALRYVLGYSTEEIGARFAIGQQGVRSRLHRVMKKLREVAADDA